MTEFPYILEIFVGHYQAYLTLSWRSSLSYRNQSSDLQSKSMDWFPYDRYLRHERVKSSPTSVNLQTLIVNVACSLVKSILNFAFKEEYQSVTVCQLIIVIASLFLQNSIIDSRNLVCFLVWKMFCRFLFQGVSTMLGKSLRHQKGDFEKGGLETSSCKKFLNLDILMQTQKQKVWNIIWINKYSKDD